MDTVQDIKSLKQPINFRLNNDDLDTFVGVLEDTGD